jgi:hypothetical protein
MDVQDQAARLREAIMAAGPPGPRRKIAVEIKRGVARYEAQRRTQGASRDAIARELDISTTTLTRWLGRPVATRPPAFRAVDIVAPAPPAPTPVPAPPPAPSLVVYGPCGVRIEGLEVAALAALLRGLA